MSKNFFINNPHFAIVISIFIVLLGLISIFKLPLEEYPQIIPPQIVVSASYPGGNAEVIESTIAAPIESAVNGVEDMIYMSSDSSDSSYSLTITFETGTDPDMALINVQNRLNLSIASLPEEVRRIGISVKEALNKGAGLMVINIYSPDSSKNKLELSNYASIHIKNALSRIKGIGEVEVRGGKDYSMRIWLNPEKMANLNISSSNIIEAIRSQSTQVPAGSVGQEPLVEKQKFQLNIMTKGRLKEPSEFENIVIRSNTDGSNVKIKDVARVELGAQSYSDIARVNGESAVLLRISQLSDANSIDISNRVKLELKRLSRSFPDGIAYEIVRDETDYIQKSMDEVVKTIFLAAILVIIITYIFLGNKRSAAVPAIAIPVSLVGTFAILYALNMSINTLILFGLVLAVGTVVDDAIVVIENVKRHLDNGLSATEATQKTMDEVGGVIITTSLILLAVFIPVGFLPGVSGLMYKQFAVCISVAVILSTVVALTLAPAISAAIMRKNGGNNYILNAFDKFFGKITAVYIKCAKFFVYNPAMTAFAFIGLCGLTLLLFMMIPTGFIPKEDKGIVFTQVKLPDGASLARTEDVVSKLEQNIIKIPGVRKVISFIGTGGSNDAFVVSRLDDWDKRKSEELSFKSIQQKINKKFKTMPEAVIFTSSPPGIPGLGKMGGFEFQLLDMGDNPPEYLEQKANELMETANNNKKLADVFHTFQANTPQIKMDIDVQKALAQGVSITEINNTLASQFGTYYINDFNKYGRVFRVQMQADSDYRGSIDDISFIYTKNKRGDMVPIDTMIDIESQVGPASLSRFNQYRAVTFNGNSSAGHSSGEAIKAMEEVADQTLPEDMSFEWSGTTKNEIESSGQTPFIISLALLFVYLFLVALYKSWSVPVSAMLIAPVAATGSLLALFLFGQDFNLYAQIGMVMLIGLTTKQAVLIVEFAKIIHEQEGLNVQDAALKAAGLRFRAVTMTALTFVIGVLPLVFAAGAGAESRISVGVTVFGGMLAAFLLGSMLVPGFYVLVQSFTDMTMGKLKSNKTKNIALFILTLVLISSNTCFAEDIENKSAINSNVKQNQVFSLNDCIKKALNNNPSISSAVNNADIYKNKIGQAWAAYFPELSVSSGYARTNPIILNTPVRNKSFNNFNLGLISMNQLIYDFGKTTTNVDFSKNTYESYKNNLQAVINDTIFDVKESYYYLLYTMQQEEVLSETVIRFEKSLEQAKAFYEIGTRPKIDFIMAEYNLSNAKFDYIKAKNEIEIAFAQLNNAMGLPEEKKYTVKDKLEKKEYDLMFEDIVKEAYENRPELLALKNKVKASESLIKLTKKQFLPDLNAFGSYGIGGRKIDPDQGFSAGVKLDLPIANAYLIKKQIAEAKSVHQKDLSDTEKLRQTVYLEVKKAYIQFNEAEEKLPVSETSLRFAKEQYDHVNGRYEVGYAIPLELKDAELVYRNAQLDYYKSLLDYNLAVANLERVIGDDITEDQNIQ